MLVLHEADRLRLVTQSDHARLAHDILSLWTRDGLSTHPQRDLLLFAAAEHDNGWREADSAPMTRPRSGRPYDFRNFPTAERQRLWQLAIDRFRDQRPAAAFLILLHARRIHGDRLADSRWEEFFRGLDEARDALTAMPQVDASVLEPLSDYLWLADTLSLGACGALPSGRLAWQNYRVELRSEKILIAPMPFAGSLKLRVPCRRIANRRYSGDAELGNELATARWRFFNVSFGPLESP